MKTMGEVIKVDPKKLLEAAENIEKSATRYEKIGKNLMDRATRMGEAWQGEDNQAFVTQIKGFTEDLESMVKKLRRVEAALQAQAKNYTDTQKSNIDNAKKLAN